MTQQSIGNQANSGRYPVSMTGFTSPHAAGVIVIGSLLLLIAIRRGFRGIGVPGVGHVGIG